MSRQALGVAIAIVRAWTRAYTWRMPAGLRESRRAEVDSDLWEWEHDAAANQRFAALEIVGRVLRGVPHDLTWRLEHASPGRWSWPIAATAATLGAGLLFVGLWLYDTLSAQTLPMPPPLRVVVAAPPPPPPPPPPPNPDCQLPNRCR